MLPFEGKKCNIAACGQHNGAQAGFLSNIEAKILTAIFPMYHMPERSPEYKK